MLRVQVLTAKAARSRASRTARQILFFEVGSSNFLFFSLGAGLELGLEVLELAEVDEETLLTLLQLLLALELLFIGTDNFPALLLLLVRVVVEAANDDLRPRRPRPGCCRHLDRCSTPNATSKQKPTLQEKGEKWLV